MTAIRHHHTAKPTRQFAPLTGVDREYMAYLDARRDRGIPDSTAWRAARHNRPGLLARLLGRV